MFSGVLVRAATLLQAINIPIKHSLMQTTQQLIPNGEHTRSYICLYAHMINDELFLCNHQFHGLKYADTNCNLKKISLEQNSYCLNSSYGH